MRVSRLADESVGVFDEASDVLAGDPLRREVLDGLLDSSSLVVEVSFPVGIGRLFERFFGVLKLAFVVVEGHGDAVVVVVGPSEEPCFLGLVGVAAHGPEGNFDENLKVSTD